MDETWKTVRADEVRVGDTVRTPSGDVLTVTRIETNFLGRSQMLAYIEDTPERWYKRPVSGDSSVEVRTSNS